MEYFQHPGFVFFVIRNNSYFVKSGFLHRISELPDVLAKTVIFTV